MDIKTDPKYKFAYGFDKETGLYVRTNILNEKNEETDQEPFMASFPHLIDVGIMGHCIHGKSGLCQQAGIECYQDGPNCCRPNMSLEDFEDICRQCTGKTNQFALGGRGDPDQHEHFEEILKLCRKYDIVPNFTTSGLGMTPEIAKLCKEYCGSVAVSMYSRILDTVPMIAIRERKRDEEQIPYQSREDIPILWTYGNEIGNCKFDPPAYVIDGKQYNWDEYHHITPFDLRGKYELYRVYEEKKQDNNYTFRAIKMLLDAGVKTNIHYVVGNNTIKEALTRLKYGGFPDGINAVVFLLHKNVGLGTEENVLKYDNPLVKEFYEALSASHSYKIGLDSCSTPGVINFNSDVTEASIDTCEGARFSCYISADMKMVPCSFDQEQKYVCDLNKMMIQEAWESEPFEKFRKSLRNSCKGCSKRSSCMGGCPLRKEIVLCNRHNR